MLGLLKWHSWVEYKSCKILSNCCELQKILGCIHLAVFMLIYFGRKILNLVTPGTGCFHMSSYTVADIHMTDSVYNI